LKQENSETQENRKEWKWRAEAEVRGQRKQRDRGQRTVEAGKQETQENRKERMARMGNGGQRAEVRGQEETETGDRGQI
jgi:hypothetical protein